jgi:hypothetical protein
MSEWVSEWNLKTSEKMVGYFTKRTNYIQWNDDDDDDEVCFVLDQQA